MNDLLAPLKASPPKHRDVNYTGTFNASGGVGAPAFLHPCGICGAAVAPFGYGVHLRSAIDAGDQKLAGRWLCVPCRASVGDLS